MRLPIALSLAALLLSSSVGLASSRILSGIVATVDVPKSQVVVESRKLNKVDQVTVIVSDKQTFDRFRVGQRVTLLIDDRNRLEKASFRSESSKQEGQRSSSSSGSRKSAGSRKSGGSTSMTHAGGGASVGSGLGAGLGSGASGVGASQSAAAQASSAGNQAVAAGNQVVQQAQQAVDQSLTQAESQHQQALEQIQELKDRVSERLADLNERLTVAKDRVEFLRSSAHERRRRAGALAASFSAADRLASLFATVPTIPSFSPFLSLTVPISFDGFPGLSSLFASLGEVPSVTPPTVDASVPKNLPKGPSGGGVNKPNVPLGVGGSPIGGGMVGNRARRARGGRGVSVTNRDRRSSANDRRSGQNNSSNQDNVRAPRDERGPAIRGGN